MRAIILAAGRGTRLAPATDYQPKCLVELSGRSLLDYQLSVLTSLGITDIIVIAGYRSDSIITGNFQMIINPDFDSSNMVHTLLCGRDLMDGESDLIISYGDIIYQPEVLQALLDSDVPLALVVDREWRRFWELRMPDPLADAETMKIDAQGMVTELGKKPDGYEEIQGQYIGLIKVRRDSVAGLLQLYDTMDPDGPYDGKTRQQMYMTSFIQHAIDSDWTVGAVFIDNGWLEVDTYDELELYQRMEAEGTLSEFMRL